MDEIFEIFFDNITGSAKRIESTSFHCVWKVEVASKFIIIHESYVSAERYSLEDHSPDVNRAKALEQMPIIMWQIHQIIMAKRPRPPKRFK